MQNTFKISALAFAVVAITGCASMSDAADAMAGNGKITVNTSSFDGSKTLEMGPAFLFSAPADMMDVGIKLGAAWSSKAPDKIEIRPTMLGSAAGGDMYTSFTGLEWNINGEISSFQITRQTRHENSDYNTASGQIYTTSESGVILSVSFIEKALAAANCKLRITTIDGVVDSDFTVERSIGGAKSAKMYLLDFVARIKEENI